MVSDLTKGIGYALKGFSLVRERKVMPFAVIPLLVNAALFGGVIWFGADAFQQFMASQLPAWLVWALVRAILWILFALSAAIVAFYTFTLVANLIAAPFNGWLSERVEVHLRGQRGDEGEERGLVGEIVASFGAELRKLVYMALWMIPLLVLFLIPGLPDDVLCFVGGLSTVPLRKLVAVALVGRAPAFFVANLVGDLAGTGNRGLAVAVGLAVVALSGLGFLYRERFVDAVLR